MSGNSGVMMYFDNMAKLTAGMSKETRFFCYMLKIMEWHKKTKMNIVNLTSHKRREIINKISPDSKDSLSLARQYLSRLCKQGRIKSIGGGAYLIDPSLFGYAKYTGKSVRDKNSFIYENRIYLPDGSVKTEAYVIDSDGQKIDLT